MYLQTEINDSAVNSRYYRNFQRSRYSRQDIFLLSEVSTRPLENLEYIGDSSKVVDSLESAWYSKAK